MHLEFYSFAELISIIKRGASLLSTNIGDEGAQEIANRARGTPRIALRLLRRIRDFLQNSSNIITHSVADYALQKLEIDKMGLDKLDINYLKFIANSSDPVGIDTISVALSEDRGNIEEAVEPYLIRINFLQRTPRGRILTSEAREYLSSKDN